MTTNRPIAFHERPNTHDGLVINQVFDANCYDTIGAPGMVCLDVGAHIGAWSLRMAWKGATVYAYEPEPENYALLLRNVHENRCLGIVHPLNLAVMGARGDYPYHKWQKSAGNTASGGMYYHDDDTPAIVVRAVTLADAVTMAGGAVDVAKFDCEGAEYDILEAATPETLRVIRRIVMEWHKTERDKDRLARHLEHVGMIVTRQRRIHGEKTKSGELYEWGDLQAQWAIP
jgi:FkbM family methyltransferase